MSFPEQHASEAKYIKSVLSALNKSALSESPSQSALWAQILSFSDDAKAIQEKGISLINLEALELGIKCYSEFLKPIYNIFKDYNLSLIAGEYYQSETSDVLNNITRMISPWQGAMADYLKRVGNKNRLSKAIQEALTSISRIKEFQEYYHYIIHRFESRLEKTYHTIINYHFEDRLTGLLNTHIRSKSEADILIFLINIKLCLVDEGYACNEDFLAMLVKIASTLRQGMESNEGVIDKNVVSSIVLYKAEFLIYKLLLRFNKESTKGYMITAEDGAVHRFELDEFNRKFLLDRFFPFRSFQDDAIAHYHSKRAVNIEELKGLGSEIIANLHKNLNGCLPVKSIHRFCKYCKILHENVAGSDLQNCIETLDQLRSRLEQEKIFCRSQKNRPNYFAYETTYNLVVTARLKLVGIKTKNAITDGDSLASQWEFFKREYFELLSQFKIEGIYPFYYHTIFSRSIIEILVKTHALVKAIDQTDIEAAGLEVKKISGVVNSLLSEYHVSNEKCKIALDQSRDAQLMPVYLTIEECIVHYEYKVEIQTKTNEQVVKDEAEPIDIFLDSSHILPSNYSYIKAQKEKENIEFNKYYFLCVDEIHSIQEDRIEKIIKSESEKFTTTFDEKETAFEGKIKDNQLNAIQLIGLYAGMITFVLGSVSLIPKFEKSYISILLFLFVFICGLSIFVALLRIIFNKDNEYVEIRQILWRTEKSTKEGEEDSKYVSKYGLFLFFCVSVFIITVGLMFHFSKQGIPIYRETILIERESMRLRSKDNLRDSVVHLKEDSTIVRDTLNKE